MQVMLAAVEALIREPMPSDAQLGTLATKSQHALNALEIVRRDVAAMQAAEAPATDPTAHPMAPKV